MANTAFKEYAQNHGGRVLLLFLLFSLALYELATSGLTIFAVICVLPAIILLAVAAFHYRMFLFWTLITANYLIQMKDMALPIPTSVPNELLQILLLALAIIDVQESKFERTANAMFYALLIWVSFCLLQVLNDTCGIGVDVAAWYTVARMIGFQLIYIFLVFSIYVTTPKIMVKYLFLWGGFALFASFWVWKQKYIGFTPAESAWINTRGRTTHIIQGGALIRYFSIYSDAANFGIGIASTAVSFLVFGITSKIKKHKRFFLAVGLACTWAMFPSGTRTAMACFMAGLMVYIFMSKSFKIAIPFTLVFGTLAFLLVFTTVGNGNAQIRRMRTAFDKNDASAGARKHNQEAMKKYLAEAPWGIGMGVGHSNAPANNKYTFMAKVPPDSEYVFIWIHTGIIGITTFLVCQAIIFLGAFRIVFFQLKSPSLRGIGAGFCCAFVSQQLGGYGNQVLLQFPNCLVFYGGMTLVYLMPLMENDWIAYEKEELEKEDYYKRLKLERKRASRV